MKSKLIVVCSVLAVASGCFSDIESEDAQEWVEQSEQAMFSEDKLGACEVVAEECSASVGVIEGENGEIIWQPGSTVGEVDASDPDVVVDQTKLKLTLYQKQFPKSPYYHRTWYRDEDGDSYGDPNCAVVSIGRPCNYVARPTDCDDKNNDVNPHQQEVCDDDLDNDCFEGDAVCPTLPQ